MWFGLHVPKPHPITLRVSLNPLNTQKTQKHCLSVLLITTISFLSINFLSDNYFLYSDSKLALVVNISVNGCLSFRATQKDRQTVVYTAVTQTLLKPVSCSSCYCPKDERKCIPVTLVNQSLHVILIENCFQSKHPC